MFLKQTKMVLVIDYKVRKHVLWFIYIKFHDLAYRHLQQTILSFQEVLR